MTQARKLSLSGPAIHGGTETLPPQSHQLPKRSAETSQAGGETSRWGGSLTAGQGEAKGGTSERGDEELRGETGREPKGTAWLPG